MVAPPDNWRDDLFVLWDGHGTVALWMPEYPETGGEGAAGRWNGRTERLAVFGVPNGQLWSEGVLLDAFDVWSWTGWLRTIGVWDSYDCLALVWATIDEP